MTTPVSILEEAATYLYYCFWKNSLGTIVDSWKAVNKTKSVTVTDALLYGFAKVCPPLFTAGKKPDGSLITFGDVTSDKDELRKVLFNHDMPLYGAKCLIARAEDSILVTDVNQNEGFLFPYYVNLQEWNDRKDQCKENIYKTLLKAIDLGKKNL